VRARQRLLPHLSVKRSSFTEVVVHIDHRNAVAPRGPNQRDDLGKHGFHGRNQRSASSCS
jgi:hypothetical protein